MISNFYVEYLLLLAEYLCLTHFIKKRFIQIKMEELISELGIVYRNYCSGIRDLEHFCNDLFGKNAKHFGPRPKSKLAVGLKQSEEGGNADAKTESCAKPPYELSKEGKNELAPEKEVGKSVPKKMEKGKPQNKQQARQLSETQDEMEEKGELEKCPDDDVPEHPLTKEALENAKMEIQKQDEKTAQIQSQLKQLKAKVKWLENNYHTEKSAHKKAKADLENAKNQRRTQDEKNIQMQNTLKQLKEKIKGLENEFHLEKSAHQKTKKALEAAKNQERAVRSKLHFNLKKQKRLAEKEHVVEIHPPESTKALETTIEELRVQLRQTKADKRCLKDNYQREKAAHQDAQEELQRANGQIESLAERCEGLRQQLQSNKQKVEEDLLTCMCVISEPNLLREAVVALKKHYLEEDERVNLTDICEEKYKLEISDLKAKIENCTALLEASLNTKTRLEEKLSNVDDLYALREQKYVKLINVHIVLVQYLEKKLRAHILKCRNPVQEKVCSWFNKKVLGNPEDTFSDDKGPLNLFPHDWRLPGIPDEELC